MADKTIREGGYQPTKDPPARPPAKALKIVDAPPTAPPVAPVRTR